VRRSMAQTHVGMFPWVDYIAIHAESRHMPLVSVFPPLCTLYCGMLMVSVVKFHTMQLHRHHVRSVWVSYIPTPLLWFHTAGAVSRLGMLMGRNPAPKKPEACSTHRGK
jgi:hypothetical protein